MLTDSSNYRSANQSELQGLVMTIQNTTTTAPSNLPELSQEILSGYSALISEIIDKHPDINSVTDCLRAIAGAGLSHFEDKMILLDDDIESGKH